jgi:hypothetical protein
LGAEPAGPAASSRAGPAAAQLRAAADRLDDRVRPWTPARWARQARGSDGLTRADLVFGLVQRIADAAADAEHRARRPVPRLDHDLALPDQLRVMVADLLTADPPADALRAAATAITTAARTL